MDELPGGKEVIKRELLCHGPMRSAELKLMIISIVLLCFWVLEAKIFGDLGITSSLAARRSL